MDVLQKWNRSIPDGNGTAAAVLFFLLFIFLKQFYLFPSGRMEAADVCLFASFFIYWRGCLDKYDRFAKQKEWRVCWLPSELNYEAKILHVGSLEDIIDIVPTKDFRRYLLKKYSGYVPGIITNNRRTIAGTESYGAFKTRMRDIDGTGEFVVEIG